MFFTSGIIIAFFCFAFYLIWNQFLRKDTRLSTGLQILRKKIGDLENLSLTVETQVDHYISTMQEKTRKLESLLQTTKQLCERMEANIKIMDSLNNKNPRSTIKENHKKIDKYIRDNSLLETKPTVKTHTEANPFIPKEPLSTLKAVTPPHSHLKMVKEPSAQKNNKKKLEFGKSPFNNIEFIDSPS